MAAAPSKRSYLVNASCHKCGTAVRGNPWPGKVKFMNDHPSKCPALRVEGGRCDECWLCAVRCVVCKVMVVWQGEDGYCMNDCEGCEKEMCDDCTTWLGKSENPWCKNCIRDMRRPKKKRKKKRKKATQAPRHRAGAAPPPPPPAPLKRQRTGAVEAGTKGKATADFSSFNRWYRNVFSAPGYESFCPECGFKPGNTPAVRAINQKLALKRMFGGPKICGHKWVEARRAHAKAHWPADFSSIKCADCNCSVGEMHHPQCSVRRECQFNFKW